MIKIDDKPTIGGGCDVVAACIYVDKRYDLNNNFQHVTEREGCVVYRD